jgi:hypothetical protein
MLFNPSIGIENHLFLNHSTMADKNDVSCGEEISRDSRFK